jgi:hypothetical protein
MYNKNKEDEMEITEIKDNILNLNKELRTAREKLRKRAIIKSNAIGKYRKTRSMILIQLKNGVEFELDGVKIVNPPASTAKEIAGGLSYKEKIAADLAESQYKNLIVGIDTIKSEINSLQSIFKYLDNV